VDGGVLGALVDLVLPRTCAGCGLPGAVLCRRCQGLLASPRPAMPRRFPDGFPPVAAAGAYAGPVRPAMIAFKERGRAELARPLGAALALAVAAVVAASDTPGRALLVPVPSTAAAIRTRGRDHVRELARVAVAELRVAGAEVSTVRLLRRRGRVRDSAELSAAQRRANLAGSFVVDPRQGPGRPGTQLVVVDDVVTSGATLTEAAGALERAFPAGPVVLAAVVAATPHAWEKVPRPSDRLSGGDRRD
jgi:predicted amidophosphoribosyltransferase